INTKYFLGYTATHFYLYIEVDADSIIMRDRGYQNGDGFHLTIGTPKANNEATDEFYVLGFSPADDWSNKINWYYNIDLAMRRLGTDVQFETAVAQGKTSFECLIPWNIIKPYHPWISDSIAFNLCFVKAVGKTDKVYHFLVTDSHMQSEQSKRKYVTLTFEKPSVNSPFFSLPRQHNMNEADVLTIDIAGYRNTPSTVSFEVKVVDTDNNSVFRKSYAAFFSEEKMLNRVSLPKYSLQPGSYTVIVTHKGQPLGAHEVSVLHHVNFSQLRTDLEAAESWLSQGTLNTLMFFTDQLEREVLKLKSYESSESILTDIEQIQKQVASVQNGLDPLAGAKGIYRRAFISEIDQTLRPYTIYVPEKYSHQKKYPLLVYLHGSGEDDRALFRSKFIREGFIVLAPNGRGTSNCFATQNSQTDIREAVTDVLKHFHIDENRIVLSGFSMGGYGVYRTYYEQPEMYSALAIISGHPNLAQKWHAPGIQLNFLNDSLLSHFSTIPMFIFHGKNDQNCPFDLTEQFVNKLQKDNDAVVFVIDSLSGHSGVTSESEIRYHEWLRSYCR
ncbi:MAG: prolyl oligopeptidase family serine peptidase, partial [Salinivirgaceae bacterium]